jgi:hypothetical protein
VADDQEDTDPMKMVYFVAGIFIVAIFLWYMSGGADRADLRGILLSPPAPLGTGEAYGPGGTTTAEQEPAFQTGTVEPPGQVQ